MVIRIGFVILAFTVCFGLVVISGCGPSLNYVSPDPWAYRPNSVDPTPTPVATVTPSPTPTPTPASSALTDTYIFTFQGTNGFNPRTAQELLDAFSLHHPQNVRSHHYRTRVEGTYLVGLICIDTAKGRDAIIQMLNTSSNLLMMGYIQATEADLATEYAMGQPSL